MEEKDDEEISIDLSKITNFFKKKKKTEVLELKEEEKKVEKETEEKIEEEKKPEIHEEIEVRDAEIKQEPDKPAETKQDEQKEDDEISIDFGKIKNIFKKKEPVSVEKIEAKEDDEVSIDFSKIKNIKNIFKKSEEPKSEESEEVSIDYKKTKDFFVRYGFILLLLIPIFLCIFLRMQPAYLPIADQWATESVINSIRSQISSQIDQQYPNLPSENKNVLIENELQKVLKEQKSEMDQYIQDVSDNFKEELQDDAGQTYLIAIDPYFWMRHAQNVIENGHPGDEIKDGQIWDNHMFAPEGRSVPADVFHAYFEAYLFKFLSFFNRDINLMKVVFYVPILISALAVIPAFFIARKIAGNFGGFIAATIIAIHPSFLTRTVGGFSDTDAYNVMFPLFIAWLFIEALDSKNIKNNFILSSIAGLLVGLYSFTWGGWWYIFDFILISTILYIAYYAFVHRKELIENIGGFVKKKAVKNSITFLLIFFIVALLSTTLFVSFPYFTKFAKNPTSFARLKEVGITTIWPNVFTTVAEQNPASLNSVIDQVGLGNFLFFLIALIGITLTMTKKEHKKLWFIIGTLGWFIVIFLFNIHTRLASIFKIQELNMFLVLISIPIIIRILIALLESDTEIEIKYAIFLVLWFIATTYASTKGVRFTLLLVPAFAIGFGVALGTIYRYAYVWISKGLRVNRIISKTTVMIILLLLLIAPYRSAAETVKNEIPSFNNAWRISLEKIKEESQPDAIVNSWWDFGHWFKFWTDRAVTFDGTSQNIPQAHWIGKVLLTDDEELAVGILRMLDCSGGTAEGGTKAFGIINEKINDGAKTVSILNDIIVKDEEDAKEYLKDMFNDEEVKEILLQTHCQPPENYFITSEDMIGKSGVWSHFGSWDFDRALIYNTLKKKEYSNDLDKSVAFLKERFDYSDTEANDLYYEVQSITSSDQANSWIAPWPGYAGSAGCSKIDDEVYGCSVSGIPLIFNLSTYDAYAESSEGRLYPKLVSFPTDEGIVLKEYNESVITLQNGRNLGVALIKDGGGYSILAMDSDLTASMFTRLFYQDGIGLRYFKKFSDESSFISSFNGRRIIVWKVDWEGKEKNIIETPESEIEEKEEAIETEIDVTIEQTTNITVEENNTVTNATETSDTNTSEQNNSQNTQ